MLITDQDKRSENPEDWLIDEAEKLSIVLAMARAIESSARKRLKELNLNYDEHLALWGLLDSKERAALKRRD